MSQILAKFAPLLEAKANKNIANGYAGLDSGGKILTSVLPAGALGGLTFKGSFDASTSAYPTSPANGDFYVVSVAGNVGGAASPALAVGDYIFYSSSLSQWEVIYAPKTADQLVEGTSNLYFTVARAQAAAVQNSLATSTVIAPSASAVNSALALKQAAFSRFKEKFVLASGDITNGYVILSHPALSASMVAGVTGGGLLFESLDAGSTGDYLLSIDGGTGNTKVTWKNDLVSGGATPLAAGDVLNFQYEY